MGATVRCNPQLYYIKNFCACQPPIVYMTVCVMRDIKICDYAKRPFCGIIRLAGETGQMILKKREGMTMKKYVCGICGYIYDPEVGDPDNGIAPGTAFEDLPEDWVCPLCSVDKTNFMEVEE